MCVGMCRCVCGCVGGCVGMGVWVGVWVWVCGCVSVGVGVGGCGLHFHPLHASTALEVLLKFLIVCLLLSIKPYWSGCSLPLD